MSGLYKYSSSCLSSPYPLLSMCYSDCYICLSRSERWPRWPDITCCWHCFWADSGCFCDRTSLLALYEEIQVLHPRLK